MMEFDALEQTDNLDDDQQSRFDSVFERITELETRPAAWTPETLAIAGAIVTLGHDGKPDIHYGFIRPEDAPRKAAKTKTVMQTKDDGSVIAVEVADKSPLPASLVESLTAYRSASLTATMMERPDIALAATVHALALQVFYNGARGNTVLQIAANVVSIHRVEGSPACDVIEKAREYWTEQLPGDSVDLFAWCLTQPQDRLLHLLAFCAAQTVNATLLKADRPNSTRMEHAALLADALKLDMATWFTPTAANYFSRISKAGIIEALREVKGTTAPAWTGMKKTELAALAERETAGTAWLPELLRASSLAQAKA
jgi:ParB family chromosome partitioning protein